MLPFNVSVPLLILFLLKGLESVSATMESAAVVIESELKDQGVLCFSSSRFHCVSFPSSFVYIPLTLWMEITLRSPILIVLFLIDLSTSNKNENNYVNLSSSFISISTRALRFPFSPLLILVLCPSQCRMLTELLLSRTFLGRWWEVG